MRRYDTLRAGVEQIIDMPHQTIDLLFRMLKLNDGNFSQRARQHEFAQLTEEEATRIEALYGKFDQAASKSLAALPSLGKVSARMLVEAGIEDEDTLRSLGPIECFRRLRFNHGSRVTINFVYALECAIRSIDWQTLDVARKAQSKKQASEVR